MRRRKSLQRSRVMRAALGALILGAPASAALADAPRGATTTATTAPVGTLEAHLRSHRIGFDQSAVVTGRAPAADAGATVALDFAAAGSGTWRQLTASQIDSTGGFRLSAPLRGSGRVKATMAAPAGTSVAFAAGDTAGSSTGPERVTVAATIRVKRRTREVLGAGTVAVRGQLLPRAPRRRVVLQTRRDGRWVTIAAARTGSRGGFGLRYRADTAGEQPLRVRFAGDRGNAPASSSAGRLVVLGQSLASWYDDAGTTACGFHAYYGVANLSLPCGARVTFNYGGRSVTATVDDRGPYVGGRSWDLNQNTAAALGFAGVGAVWSSS